MKIRNAKKCFYGAFYYITSQPIIKEIKIIIRTILTTAFFPPPPYASFLDCGNACGFILETQG
jgi:hypothetical protein